MVELEGLFRRQAPLIFKATVEIRLAKAPESTLPGSAVLASKGYLPTILEFLQNGERFNKFVWRQCHGLLPFIEAFR